MADPRQYVTLGAGGEVFALPVERVREILENRAPTRMPNAPAAFLGVIDVRGESVSVFDLRTQLGFDRGVDDDDTRILVLTIIAGDRGETAIGLKADRVFEVTVLDQEDRKPPVATGSSWDSRCIIGLGRRNEAIVTLLDVDRLFETGEAGADAGGHRVAA